MLNKVLIIGRLVRDPIIRYLPSGTPTTEFGLVWNRRYKVEEEWKEESHFFDVKAYGSLAENLSSKLSKGYTVVVEGRLAQERWTDQEGNTRSRVRIIAEAVRIIRKPRIDEVEEEELLTKGIDIEEELKEFNKEKPPFDEDDEIPF